MKTVVVTGATSGLGRRTAERLARDPSLHVVGTGRSADATVRILRGTAIEPLPLNLGSQEDVARFAAELCTGDRPPLAALIANAGIQVTSPTISADGFEATFAVNHLGHVALIARLLAAGALPRGSRIVLVASGTHDPDLRTGMPAPRIASARELATPAPDTESAVTAGRRRYTTSKLANVLTTYELARRLEPRGVTVTAFDPGLMPGTGLARDASPLERVAFATVMRAMVVLPGVSTPARAARELARMATDPGYAGVTGRYVSIDRERSSSRQSYDERLQHALWTESLELLGLDDGAA
jgi:NAD(P)-dependent dehydrogenase (short-subunit alcohol dehydrogenase family)